MFRGVNITKNLKTTSSIKKGLHWFHKLSRTYLWVQKFFILYRCAVLCNCVWKYSEGVLYFSVCVFTVYLFIFANSKHSFFSFPEVESVEILSMTGPVVINSGNDVTLDCYYNYRYGTSKWSTAEMTSQWTVAITTGTGQASDPQRKWRHNGLLL